ncbi:MAG: type II toxin-antitoxin system HicB family antitoxin [Dehalococcoidia bacterium]
MARESSKHRRFHVRFEEADEGGYVVSIPEMPGCVTEGESFEEGLAMVEDALKALLEVAIEHGDPIPEQFRDLAQELAKQPNVRRLGIGRQATRTQTR